MTLINGKVKRCAVCGCADETGEMTAFSEKRNRFECEDCYVDANETEAKQIITDMVAEDGRI